MNQPIFPVVPVKRKSSLPRYFASTGFSLGLISLAIAYGFYLFIVGLEKTKIQNNEFFVSIISKVLGLEEHVHDFIDKTREIPDMRIALWIMLICGIICFILGFFGKAACKVGKAPLPLITGILSIAGGITFFIAAWVGFDCWYLGILPFIFYVLSGAFSIKNSF